MRKALLGLSVDFFFSGMGRQDKRFDNLYLFENEERIDVRHRKATQLDDGKSYSIRIFSDLANYLEMLDLVLDTIELQSDFLAELELNQEICFAFFVEYYGDIQWPIKSQQLKKLSSLTDYSGISLDSIDRSWNDDRESQEQVVYYQLIFSSRDKAFDSDLIKQKWQDEFLGKYEPIWSLPTDTRIVLSIKKDLNQFKWDEQFRDLVIYVSKYLGPFLEKGISIDCGFYQHNSDSLSGGEIGGELIEEITKLGLGLVFTLSDKPPKRTTENKM